MDCLVHIGIRVGVRSRIRARVDSGVVDCISQAVWIPSAISAGEGWSSSINNGSLTHDRSLSEGTGPLE